MSSKGSRPEMLSDLRLLRPPSLRRIGVVLVLALAGAGCGSSQQAASPSDPMTVGSVGAGAASAPTAKGYILGPGDKLRILVFNEQELSREYEVDTAGKVTLPLVGSVDAAGTTPADLQERIRQSLLKGYLRDPKVSVEVVNYRPFYVIGEVSKSGEYPFKNGMNVISAVAVAGGYTYRANTGTVYVRRANETAERAYDVSSAVMVYPGDIVRVPERFF